MVTPGTSKVARLTQKNQSLFAPLSNRYCMYFEKRNFSIFSRFSSEMKITFTQPLFAKETNRTVQGCVSLTKINLNLRGVVNEKHGYFTVRLTVRVDHTHVPTHTPHTPKRQLFVIFFGVCKKQVFFLPKNTVLSPLSGSQFSHLLTVSFL